MPSKMNLSGLPLLMSVVLQILVPVMLVLTSVELILATAKTWTRIEYNLPGFPPDPYGFSTDDRLFWSAKDIDFLNGNFDLSYFDELKLADGSPMHNARELRHMDDVNRLVKSVRQYWLAGWVGVLIVLLVLWRMAGPAALGNTLLRSVRLTLIGMAAIGALLLFGFSLLFVGFHRIFFEGTTWIFPLSDTFIRLYPERFWRDTFVLIVLITLVEGGVVALFGRLIRRKAP